MIIFNGTDENAQDVVECASTILSTPYAAMPYMRDMGITAEALKGLNVGDDGLYYAEAVDQIEAWEDRASISELTVDSIDGNVVPKVVIGNGE